MDEGTLFDIPDGARIERAPEPKLTPGEALRARQAAKLARAMHPLSKPGWPPILLHREAAPAVDTDAAGLRCGGCRFRTLLPGGGRTFPKCTLPNTHGHYSRASHSAASDVRAWWPACRDYQPKETQ